MHLPFIGHAHPTGQRYDLIVHVLKWQSYKYVEITTLSSHHPCPHLLSNEPLDHVPLRESYQGDMTTQ